jgi:hypothetical protein
VGAFRINKASMALLIGSAIFAFMALNTHAQSPGRGDAAQPAGPAQAGRAQANLGQLMKGTFYPAANVVFAAQDLDPAVVPRAKDPNMATDLLASSYGKWEAVENSALAIAELADLLMVPGRKCANGLEVPVNNPDWAKFVQELRDAGMKAYAAAQTKDQDKMIDVSGAMTTACAHCHNKYRERARADRCK